VRAPAPLPALLAPLALWAGACGSDYVGLSRHFSILGGEELKILFFVWWGNRLNRPRCKIVTALACATENDYTRISLLPKICLYSLIGTIRISDKNV